MDLSKQCFESTELIRALLRKWLISSLGFFFVSKFRDLGSQSFFFSSKNRPLIDSLKPLVAWWGCQFQIHTHLSRSIISALGTRGRNNQAPTQMERKISPGEGWSHLPSRRVSIKRKVYIPSTQEVKKIYASLNLNNTLQIDNNTPFTTKRSKLRMIFRHTSRLTDFVFKVDNSLRLPLRRTNFLSWGGLMLNTAFTSSTTFKSDHERPPTNEDLIAGIIGEKGKSIAVLLIPPSHRYSLSWDAFRERLALNCRFPGSLP